MKAWALTKRQGQINFHFLKYSLAAAGRNLLLQYGQHKRKTEDRLLIVH